MQSITFCGPAYRAKVPITLQDTAASVQAFSNRLCKFLGNNISKELTIRCFSYSFLTCSLIITIYVLNKLAAPLHFRFKYSRFEKMEKLGNALTIKLKNVT